MVDRDTIKDLVAGAVIIFSLSAIMAMCSCASTRPALYDDRLPAIEPPALTEFLDTPGDCAVSEGMDPGESTDCGGILVPTKRALELNQVDRILIPWYADALARERAYRLIDREHGQVEYSILDKDCKACYRAENAWRVITPAGIAAGIIVGIIIGVNAE